MCNERHMLYLTLLLLDWEIHSFLLSTFFDATKLI
nr:MAG TPA: hypothetical protein [Caudoviricetes sp.]DAU53645.1 MAG TPA: hypothetical protein [Caudoviricetes sp.]